MNLQINAAYELHQFLTARKIPYVIIGGMAIQCWGEPRFTRDVDVTLLVALGSEDKVIAEILQFFTPRVPDAAEFARKKRVLLVKNQAGCDIDISLGIPGYEEEVMARAVDYDLGGGRTVKLCSAEDLVIHKAVAGRPQDCLDIEGIVLRQGKRLDADYVLRWLKDFANLLETDEVLTRFSGPWNRFQKSKIPPKNVS